MTPIAPFVSVIASYPVLPHWLELVVELAGWTAAAVGGVALAFRREDAHEGAETVGNVCLWIIVVSVLGEANNQAAEEIVPKVHLGSDNQWHTTGGHFEPGRYLDAIWQPIVTALLFHALVGFVFFLAGLAVVWLQRRRDPVESTES